MSYQWPAWKVGIGAAVAFLGLAIQQRPTNVFLVAVGMLLVAAGVGLAAAGVFQGVELAGVRSRARTGTGEP